MGLARWDIVVETRSGREGVTGQRGRCLSDRRSSFNGYGEGAPGTVAHRLVPCFKRRLLARRSETGAKFVGYSCLFESRLAHQT